MVKTSLPMDRNVIPFYRYYNVMERQLLFRKAEKLCKKDFIYHFYPPSPPNESLSCQNTARYLWILNENSKQTQKIPDENSKNRG